MKFEMKKSHISTAVALAICGTFVTSAQAAPAFLSDGAGTATTIANAGYFQPGGVGLSYLGREFVNWDTLASNYTLEANGATVAVGDEVSLSNPFSSVTFGPIGGPISVTTNLGGAGGGWGFLETVSITAPGHVSVMVQLTNLTGSVATDVHWGVGFDPDQGRGAGLGNGTFNVINATGTSDSSVSASTSDGAIITLANNTSAGAFEIRPYVDPLGCCSPVSPGLMLATAQAAGSYGFGDNSINLAYNLGTIANNDSVKIGYEYIMAVPEPETYAMLLAGLGLIGFSARRRISA